MCVPITYIPDSTYPLGLYLRWLGINYDLAWQQLAKLPSTFTTILIQGVKSHL